jgi:hypothetical protein
VCRGGGRQGSEGGKSSLVLKYLNLGTKNSNCRWEDWRRRGLGCGKGGGGGQMKGMSRPAEA